MRSPNADYLTGHVLPSANLSAPQFLNVETTTASNCENSLTFYKITTM